MVSGSGILGAAIGPANRDRAVLLVDTLFKALEAAGQQINATESGLKAVVDGETLVLRLGESKDKKEHQPKSELKAKADWEKQREKWPSFYERDRQMKLRELICTSVAATYFALPTLAQEPPRANHAEVNSGQAYSIMSWSEYLSRAREMRWPYVLEISTPRGGLVDFGAQHSYSPQDLQISQIEALWID